MIIIILLLNLCVMLMGCTLRAEPGRADEEGAAGPRRVSGDGPARGRDPEGADGPRGLPRNGPQRRPQHRPGQRGRDPDRRVQVPDQGQGPLNRISAQI